jgi:hypothetical protein
MPASGRLEFTTWSSGNSVVEKAAVGKAAGLLPVVAAQCTFASRHTHRWQLTLLTIA